MEKKSKRQESAAGIPVRGRVLTATVISTKMRKTAVCEIKRTHELKKYQRYEKRITRIKAHHPDSVSVSEGDTVRLGECRPLSKTKRYVIIEKVE